MIGQLLLVAAGGALGAVGRYAISLWAMALFSAGFPWGILICNVAGSAAIGFVVIWTQALGPGAGDGWRLFLAVGVMGGFTTFSAFSLDLVGMIEDQRFLVAGLYVAGSVVLCALGAALGLWFGRFAVGGGVA